MARLRVAAAVSGFIFCTAAGIYLWPQARDSARLLLAQDDPVALADVKLASVMQNDRAAIQKQIETALADGDSDLAQSFVELAQGRNVALSDELTARVAARVADDTSTLSTARRFAAGFVTGDVNDMASLSGTVAGDLFVYGDIRDMVREGKRLSSGEEADHLILGLAAAGIAVTAATYASAGTAAPMRAGLSLVKGARKAGRISEGLAKWGTRSAREMVDAPALRHAVGAVSVALVRLGKDVGRITGKAGGRGAMDVLKVAQGPKDVARAARLAEANGGATRAILKLLGRGALVLASGAFNLTMWLFGALMTLVGILVSIKSGTERLTQMWCNRRRRRRNKALVRELRSAQDRLAVAA